MIMESTMCMRLKLKRQRKEQLMSLSLEDILFLLNFFVPFIQKKQVKMCFSSSQFKYIS